MNKTMKVVLTLTLLVGILYGYPYPQVTAPSDVGVFVLLVGPAACQLIEQHGDPCIQHVNVLLFPHNPGKDYDVTITYNFGTQPGLVEVRSWTKRASPYDGQCMPTMFVFAPYDIKTVAVQEVQASKSTQRAR